jgi:hypothetical protein
VASSARQSPPRRCCEGKGRHTWRPGGAVNELRGADAEKTSAGRQLVGWGVSAADTERARGGLNQHFDETTRRTSLAEPARRCAGRSEAQAAARREDAPYQVVEEDNQVLARLKVHALQHADGEGHDLLQSSLDAQTRGHMGLDPDSRSSRTTESCRHRRRPERHRLTLVMHCSQACQLLGAEG